MLGIKSMPNLQDYPDTGVVGKAYDSQDNLLAVTDAEGHVEKGSGYFYQ